MKQRLLNARNFFRRGEAQPSEADTVERLVINQADFPSWTTGTSLMRTIKEPLAKEEWKHAPEIPAQGDELPDLPRRMDRWE